MPLYIDPRIVPQGLNFRIFNTADQEVNAEWGQISWDTNELAIRTFRSGTGAARNIVLGADGGINARLASFDQSNFRFLVCETLGGGGVGGTGTVNPLTIRGGTGTALQGLVFAKTSSHTATSGTQYGAFYTYSFTPTSGTAEFRGLGILATINQTGGANGTVNVLNVDTVNTAIVGTVNLINLQSAGAQRFAVDINGYENLTSVAVNLTAIATSAFNHTCTISTAAAGDLVFNLSRISVAPISAVNATPGAIFRGLRIEIEPPVSAFGGGNITGHSVQGSITTLTPSTTGTMVGSHAEMVLTPTAGSPNMRGVSSTMVVNQAGAAGGDGDLYFGDYISIGTQVGIMYLIRLKRQGIDYFVADASGTPSDSTNITCRIRRLAVGTTERLLVGPTDSAGAGRRAIYVPN